MKTPICLLMGALLAAPALAKEGETQGDVVGETPFIRPLLAQSAFLTPEVGITEGIASFYSNRYPLGTLGRRDVDYFGFQQTLEGAFRFTDWIGLQIFAGGNAVAGVNVTSLFLRTGSFDINAEASIPVRLYENRGSGTLITLRGFGAWGAGHEISLLPLLQGIFKEPGATLEQVFDGNLRKQLMVPTHDKTAGGGLYWAQGFTRAFSLQASLRFEYTWHNEQPADLATGERINEDSTAYEFDPALALLYDFDAHGVPVALIGEYRLRAGSRTGTTLLNGDIQDHTVSLGVFYSGRRNLQLGVSVAALVRGEPLIGVDENDNRSPSDYVRARYAQLTLRYVW